MREWENLVIRPGGHAGRRFAEYVGETVFLSATEKLRCSCRRLPQGTVTVFLTLKQETAGTEDSFLVDLAVAANITMILVENRESAYYTVLNNRLLQLEEKIGG